MLIEILRALLFIVFIISSLLLIVVILLQEGKGGGLASAFGGMGGEAFGVGSGGINRFTAILASVFIGSAILLASIHPSQAPEDIVPDNVTPVGAPDGAGQPDGAEAGGTGDAGNTGADDGGGAEKAPADDGK
jgi:preprotein translocase subunit SecG